MGVKMSGNVSFTIMVLLCLAVVLVAWAGVRVGMAQGERDRAFAEYRAQFYEKQTLTCYGYGGDE